MSRIPHDDVSNRPLAGEQDPHLPPDPPRQPRQVTGQFRRDHLVNRHPAPEGPFQRPPIKSSDALQIAVEA